MTEKAYRYRFYPTPEQEDLWKKEEELNFLNDVSSVPLQQGLRHLQTAFTKFFAGRVQYPNFKKKRHGGSAEFTKAASIKRNNVTEFAVEGTAPASRASWGLEVG